MVAAPALMAVAAVASIASAGIAAMSAIQQGKAADKAAKYNAEMGERNAVQAEQAAAVNEQRQRERARKIMASQRAAVAASGVDLEGSPLLAFEESAANAEFDALTIRHQGQLDAQRYRSQAAIDRFEGKVAKQRGYMQAGASVLQGVSSAASIYGKMPTKAPTPAPQPQLYPYGGT